MLELAESSAEGLGMAMLLAAFAVLAILRLFWRSNRSKTLLDQWAQANGYKLLSAQSRHLSRGPFFFTTSKGQTVYRIRVEDTEGNIREGYARCGSWIGGLLSDKVDVRWD
jgi:hypothetical protein